MYDESQSFAETAAEPTEDAPVEQPDQDQLPAEADGHDAAENTTEL